MFEIYFFAYSVWTYWNGDTSKSVDDNIDGSKHESTQPNPLMIDKSTKLKMIGKFLSQKFTIESTYYKFNSNCSANSRTECTSEQRDSEHIAAVILFENE